MFQLAGRNQVKIKYETVDELKAAYAFNNLQEFLDIYYDGAAVLITEQDFYDMTWAYLEKIHSQNVVHTEIFFDPQTHTERGIAFETVVNGIDRALQAGREKLGISSFLIMCFVRHLDESEAFKTLGKAMPFKSKIIGIGLASSELGNPPSKFQNVFARAVEQGFIPVAHAGEEGPAEYVWEALNLLKVQRIDHGNRSLDDADLVTELVERQMALTVCPLSNLELQVVPDLRDHPIREMLNAGLRATVNSDDPAYFGGYMNENFIALADAVDLTATEITQLNYNAIQASFLPPEAKEKLLALLGTYVLEFEK